MQRQCIFAFALLLRRTPQSEGTMQTLEKRNHYFCCSNMVLLREAHLAAAAGVLTRNPLSRMSMWFIKTQKTL